MTVLSPEGVGRAEAGREVLVLRLPQVVVHPEILGAPDRRDRPAEAQTGVRIGAIVALAHQRRIVGLRLVEAVVDRRDMHREVVPQRVGERRRQLVAQAGEQREFVRHLPVVVDERVEDVADEFSLGDGQRDARPERLAEQELGEGVAAGVVRRVPGAKRRELEAAAGKLVADLVEVLPGVLSADADGVASLQPGQLVDELQRVVVDGERAVGDVTDSVEPGERDARNAPRDRVAGFQVRDLQIADHIVGKGREGADRVEELGVAEPRVVDQRGAERPGVRAAPLLVVRDGLRTRQADALGRLRVVAPVVPPHPLRRRRFVEVGANDVALAIERL